MPARALYFNSPFPIPNSPFHEVTPQEYIRRKKVYPHALTSEQVDNLSAEFREAAAWIVGVEEEYIIQSYYKVVQQILEGKLSSTEARRRVRSLLTEAGYQADKPGSFSDLKDGTARQKLIIETNVQKAAGHAWQETVKGSLAFPAQKLTRLGSRNQPRAWEARWRNAYQSLPADEKAKACLTPWVALTSGSIWSLLSRWGDPVPPYDYNSGMDVMPVDYSTCVQLGLLPDKAAEDKHQQEGKASHASFNEGRERKTDNPQIKQWLEQNQLNHESK